MGIPLRKEETILRNGTPGLYPYRGLIQFGGNESNLSKAFEAGREAGLKEPVAVLPKAYPELQHLLVH